VLEPSALSLLLKFSILQRNGATSSTSYKQRMSRYCRCAVPCSHSLSIHASHALRREALRWAQKPFSVRCMPKCRVYRETPSEDQLLERRRNSEVERMSHHKLQVDICRGMLSHLPWNKQGRRKESIHVSILTIPRLRCLPGSALQLSR